MSYEETGMEEEVIGEGEEEEVIGEEGEEEEGEEEEEHYKFEMDMVKFDWKKAVEYMYIERFYRDRNVFPEIPLDVPKEFPQKMMDVSHCPYIFCTLRTSNQPVALFTEKKVKKFSNNLDKISIGGILRAMEGKLVLAGEDISSSLINNGKYNDTTFNFYIVAKSEREAENTLKKAVMYFIDAVAYHSMEMSKKDTDEDIEKKLEKKTKEERNNMNVIRYRDYTELKYIYNNVCRFFHRIYPTASSVIYDFDTPYDMFWTTDGINIFTSPLGNLMVNTGICVIDPHRYNPHLWEHIKRDSVTMMMVGCSHEKIVKDHHLRDNFPYVYNPPHTDLVFKSYSDGNIYEGYFNHHSISRKIKPLVSHPFYEKNFLMRKFISSIKFNIPEGLFWFGSVNEVFPKLPSDYRVYQKIPIKEKLYSKLVRISYDTADNIKEISWVSRIYNNRKKENIRFLESHWLVLDPSKVKTSGKIGYSLSHFVYKDTGKPVLDDIIKDVNETLQNYVFTQFPYKWVRYSDKPYFEYTPLTSEQMYGEYYMTIETPKKIKNLLMCVKKHSLHKDVCTDYFYTGKPYYGDPIGNYSFIDRGYGKIRDVEHLWRSNKAIVVLP